MKRRAVDGERPRVKREETHAERFSKQTETRRTPVVRRQRDVVEGRRLPGGELCPGVSRRNSRREVLEPLVDRETGVAELVVSGVGVGTWVPTIFGRRRQRCVAQGADGTCFVCV